MGRRNTVGENRRMSLMPAAAAALVVLLGACTAFDTPHTYNRHRLSDISLPRDSGSSGVIYFDVTVTAEFPDNDPVAEAERMTWLAESLEQRSMCLLGYDIVSRRAFDFMEDNPARRDLRYEVRCRTS